MFCDHCGLAIDGDEPGPGLARHVACRAARELEPPRFCRDCRRRMVVQVTPLGWSARCSEHGVTVG